VDDVVSLLQDNLHIMPVCNTNTRKSL